MWGILHIMKVTSLVAFVFLKEEKICYKMVYYTIYTDGKQTFLKEVWHLKG